MTERIPHSSAETATLALDEVAKRADALITAWDGDDLPPNLTEFLPAEPLALRQLVLIELVKIDLEYRWQQHELPKQVEEYIEEFPELTHKGEIPCDLIYEEFHVRQQTASAPTPDDYYARFPAQADRLRRMMSLDPDQGCSTTLISGQRAAEVEPGQQIDDFDLLIRLGKGSFASVFLARQRSMQRLVALKISRDRGVEPQTLAQLDHPHIVRVYDQRLLADRKLQLMYMQHVPGGTLADVVHSVRQQPTVMRSGMTVLEAIDYALSKHGDSPPTESGTRRRLASASWPETVCWIGARLAAALDYAHQRGVLHRDVKPANVLLAADGSPKLVDFNVSFSSKVEGATPAAYFGGSLAYMSPEQLEAYSPDHDRKPDELDGRSDVYSLGIVLWELLTGARPLGDDKMMEANWHDTRELLKRMIENRRAGLPSDATRVLPGNLPPGLREILLACLSPNLEDRPATAGHLARQLDLCLQPRAQDLMHPPAKSKRHWVRHWPVASFIIIGLMPSVILSALNLEFNRRAIINPVVSDFFANVEVPAVNGVMFPIAIIAVVRFAWPVLTAVRRALAKQAADREDLPRARRRALSIGDFAAWFGMALWMLSGIIFPGWLHLHFGEIEGAGLPEFRNFIASQIACGWISSTLTFFLLTFLMVRALYPVLVQPDTAHGDEVEGLLRLERRCGRYVYVAVAAPFVALSMMITSLILSSTTDKLIPIWMGILTFFGVLCCFLAFKLLQVIRADLAALAGVIDPQRESATVGSDTVSSFLTASR